nr:MAG TPA: hypothetical protein [Herelleviridae sp.]
MFNIKEMITKNREREKEDFDNNFKEIITDLNNKILKAIENKEFSFEDWSINLETKDHPKFTKVVDKLLDRKSGMFYSNTINNAEYKVPDMKRYSNGAKLSLKVKNHPNKIEHIDIIDYCDKGRYEITIG